MSPAHGRTEEGRQGVPPGAVRVSVPHSLPNPPPGLLNNSRVWMSVVTFMVHIFADLVPNRNINAAVGGGVILW